ncbi:type III secretion system inner membrane ring lipoprotein SctJ [Chitinimonas koreensis]|uniref:type III secretion system inner membrane ring lipoprotein SctJ n=1 Tax=Chitinimonas koreensis TaxID=356302 RepID=UPI00041F3279|nr:type III secretion inner membrane ring lipoprotein SctJ [Chitinimonas koreensis]QNM97619.1 type III secretion inner membrane ring lipoprotein SctJ [Chitinimonas koreensis]
MTAAARPSSRWLALALVLALAGCGGRVDLQSGLSDEEANDIIAVLRDGGIDAGKRTLKEGYAVAVEEAELGRAVNLLHAHGLPRRRYERMGDIFKKEGMISTPLEERARYLYALSQELEHTLGQIDGVVVARVHVVLPDRVAPGEPLLPSSAAVFIKHQATLDPDLVQPRVRHLVTASIPGLAQAGRDKVSVVFMPVAEVASPVRWRTVGPFQVTESSAAALQATLIGGGLLGLVAVALALGWRRLGLGRWLRGRSAADSGERPADAAAAAAAGVATPGGVAPVAEARAGSS